MITKIPYVISEAHPDYKRPWLDQQFGTIDENLIDTFFVEKASEFIYDRTNNDAIESVDDIKSFWDNFFDECYMDNSPWDATVFINGEWQNVSPSNVEIFECLNRIRTAYKQDKEDNKEADKEESEEEELFDWQLTDEEHQIQEKMKAYMETELEKTDLELMSKMNQTEQIIYVLNKCMLNISSVYVKYFI
jgi:hypothetical protein